MKLRKRIVVGSSNNGWSQKFLDALKEQTLGLNNVEFCELDIDRNGWIDEVDKSDLVLWKPRNMGIESASHLKEKIFFIEQHLGKISVPNFATVWHFESKVAQSYIFKRYNIRTPRTAVSFSRAAAVEALGTFDLPLVLKRGEGAGSLNVRLIKTKSEALAEIDRVFRRDIVQSELSLRGQVLGRVSLQYLRMKKERSPSFSNRPVIYWQEFLSGNPRDLRITVVGNKYAFGFWRNNRENDFRASGSGSIDYDLLVPEEAISYCLRLSTIMNFDSMSYDLLFAEGRFVISEMSYGYMDTAIYNAKGYYQLVDGDLQFFPGNTWPQELWVRWAIQRLANVNYVRELL